MKKVWKCFQMFGNSKCWLNVLLICELEVNKKRLFLVNKKRLFLCALQCIYVVKFQLESLLSISHIQLFCFPFNVSDKLNANLNEAFQVTPPTSRFSFFTTQELWKFLIQVFLVGFSSFLVSTLNEEIRQF